MSWGIRGCFRCILRKRFLWDVGCILGLSRGCVGGVRGCKGVFRVHFASEMAQVELKSGRV